MLIQEPTLIGIEFNYNVNSLNWSWNVEKATGCHIERQSGVKMHILSYVVCCVLMKLFKPVQKCLTDSASYLLCLFSNNYNYNDSILQGDIKH